MNNLFLDTDHLFGFFLLDMEKIKEWAEQQSAKWDGDNAGIKEERTHNAQEIIDTLEKLQILIHEAQELGEDD
jgi:hypothetical protein